MALTSLTSTFTSYGPLSTSEVWVCTDGNVLITYDSSADASQGIMLSRGQQQQIPPGLTFYAKAVGPLGNVSREIGFPLMGAGGGGDKIVTGTASLSAINTDLISGTVNGWYDVSAFNSGTIQIIGSAGISAGTVTFEGTNDTALSAAGSITVVTSLSSGTLQTSTSPSASSAFAFEFPVTTKYFRARISTAIVGGTVQAVLALSQRPYAAPQTQWSSTATLIASNADNIWWQESVTAQAGAATVTGTARDTAATATAHRYSAFNAQASADVAGTLRIEVSNDNTTWHPATANVSLAAASSGFAVQVSIPVIARYHRAVFINGAGAQARFLLNTSYTAA